MTTTEAQKKASKKWIETHREKFNAVQLANNIRYYHLNKDKILQKKKEYYLKKKGVKETEQNIEISL